MSRNKIYPTFSEFGELMNKNVFNPMDQSNPLTYCIMPTFNSQFLHGSTSSNLLYTPYGPGCANYMAERCSDVYDGFCEGYKVMNTDTYWPNVAAIDNLTMNIAKNYLKVKSTVGQSMIRNAAERRFLVYSNVSQFVEPFDPNVANSPLYTKYSQTYNIGRISYKNLDDPSAVDSDQLLDAVCENWPACFDVLTKIYIGYKNKDPNIKIYPSKFEVFLKEKSKIFEDFICFLKTVPNYPLAENNLISSDYYNDGRCYYTW